MDIQPFSLPGVFEITLNPREDYRGYFMRVFDEEIFAEYGLHQNWVQENHSFSKQQGTVRGLHFQFPPFTETKLIRVLHGRIFDVFVDLRKNSPTFGMWGSIELSEDNYKMLYLPKGFAHGFCSLTRNSEVCYKVDQRYSPQHEGGILWRDTFLQIPWPTETPILSQKDSQLPSYSEFLDKYEGLMI